MTLHLKSLYLFLKQNIRLSCFLTLRAKVKCKEAHRPKQWSKHESMFENFRVSHPYLLSEIVAVPTKNWFQIDENVYEHVCVATYAFWRLIMIHSGGFWQGEAFGREATSLHDTPLLIDSWWEKFGRNALRLQNIGMCSWGHWFVWEVVVFVKASPPTHCTTYFGWIPIKILPNMLSKMVVA